MVLVTFREISVFCARREIYLSQTGRSRKFQRHLILTETVVAAGGQVFRRVMRTAPSFAGPERLDFRS